MTLGKDWNISEALPAPKGPSTLPVVPSPAEVVRFLDCVANPRHRAVLTTWYAAGLRISEAVSLRPRDIDSARMVIRVEQGKDRYVMLSPKLLEILRYYWRRARPAGEWLFPGQRPGRHVSQGTVAYACLKARANAGLADKPLTPHNGMQSVMETQFHIWLETKRFDFIILTIAVCPWPPLRLPATCPAHCGKIPSRSRERSG